MAARFPSFDFLRGYVITMRPYLLFVSGITGLLGLSLAPGMSIGSTLLLGTVFFLSYGFGQALTDCYQLDTDSLSAPYRPLVRGTIRRGHVLLVSFLGLAAIGVIVALYNELNIPLAALTVAGIATYTQFKRKWWAGPFYNAWIVAVLAAIGYSAGLGPANLGFAITPVVVASLATVFFGYANFVLTGYYKDISADRATGYYTFPVVFGLTRSNLVSNIFAALMLLSAGVAMSMTLGGAMPTDGQILAVLFFTSGAIATLIGQGLLHTVTGEQDAHVAITPVVHAYILTLSAVATLQKPAWGPALLVFYVGFLVAMRVRPMREQI
jgi:4-hydroxybenzoate polyprenyltransferase